MLKLHAAFSPNPRIQPLIDGTVQAAGIELDFTLGGAGELFEWHLQGSDCDVFEFSISHHMTVMERDDPRWDWVAIPIFLSKAVPALGTQVRADAGIETAADLRARRFGVPDFSMTGAVWLRAMLDQLYGIKPRDITWFVGRPRELCHDLALGVPDTLAPGISATWLLEDGGLERMMAAQELDAAFLGGPEAIDAGATRVQPLFPDGGQEFFGEFYAATGFLPVNHSVMIRRRVVEENPWVAEALYEAFEASKQTAYRQQPGSALVFPRRDPGPQTARYGPDPFPSGLSANRAMLEMVARQSWEEGLTARQADVDALFVAPLRGT
jgi:4,5-dihydroxyphthalate decarboxylase